MGGEPELEKRDQQRLAEIEEELKLLTTRSVAIGYDRYWNRYWLLGRFSDKEQGGGARPAPPRPALPCASRQFLP